MTRIFNFIIFASVFSFISIKQALAQGLVNQGILNTMTDNTGKTAGFNTSAQLGSTMAGIIQGALGLLSIIFIILTISAGFRWMTAGGNEESIKKAQKSLTSSIIGLVIVLAAWGIVYFVFTYLPFGGTSSSVMG